MLANGCLQFLHIQQLQSSIIHLESYFCPLANVSPKELPSVHTMSDKLLGSGKAVVLGGVEYIYLYTILYAYYTVTRWLFPLSPDTPS